MRYALSQLLQANYSIVLKYLIKLTLNEHDAEDLTQDVIVKAIKNINSFDSSKASFSTWLITIAKNLWLDSVRKNNVREKFFRKSQNRFETSTNQVDSFIESEEVLSALKNLSDKLRIPIIMQYNLGYSYDEIAKHLRIPIGTVKSRISNGVKALRKELCEYEEE
ncbi:sigma-70 family RNA polymerase sigma factor [Clostridium cadaveris]|uniref:RNA polymerase sigma factor n=1 Tax=Clostridium cadaveris TaxID=1529 RepID=A0A1I2JS84_9CLOT|nr:sigma-70 family RNA polymerase sigma factor [Clostridium cadaveris]MDM8310544.1 sigma-70 family RNA polymerase sigma factor [Clostridium cadaveris]NME64368.1 sigma-70 family RNA polymerase sigma factor [Clostridium cadaveris]NWK12008.1 sigma-70 family RNA polymerase sigma factor [Clostridium cadaveris]PWL53190.1 MAG: RNA polymerase sigma factor SigY [Clostridium cadaveris]SFF57682.1 RNA polymerase, sigma subunit, SigY [Clostridium cadaveris]